MKTQIAQAEARLAFTVKSATAQLKREALHSVSSSSSSSSAEASGEKKPGALAAVKKSLTPAMVFYFLIFWMLWSVSSQLSTLTAAINAAPPKPPQ